MMNGKIEDGGYFAAKEALKLAGSSLVYARSRGPAFACVPTWGDAERKPCRTSLNFSVAPLFY